MLINSYVQPPLSGHLFGLTLSNDATNPNTTIDISTGVAADSTNTYLFQLSSAFTKVLQSSGSWASGSGNNGLDSGASAASTWYNVFIIGQNATGSGDILFSVSLTSPTLPSGYSYFQRIGAILTNSSGNILAFTQTGDEFIWVNSTNDVNGDTSLGTTSKLYTLSVPFGVKVQARVRTCFQGSAAGVQCAVRSPDENSSQGTGFTYGSGFQMEAVSTSIVGVAELLVRTNTSSQIAAIANANSGNTFNLRTVGWIDYRGRQF